MFSSLRKIENSLSRNITAIATAGSKSTIASVIATVMISFAAAVTAGAVIALTSVVVFGLIKPKDESANKAAMYASIGAIGSGAILGLVYISQASGKPSKPASSDERSAQQPDDRSWKNWRDFVVVRKVKESEEITSFYLQPKDKGEIPNFQPGQFLTHQTRYSWTDKARHSHLFALRLPGTL